MRIMSDFKKLLLSGKATSTDWENLKNNVLSECNNLPMHLKLYLSDLKQIESTGLKKDDIVILDHGCGSGISVLFLLGLIAAAIKSETRFNPIIKHEKNIEDPNIIV